MECKILIRSLKDSAADSKLKLLKEGETFGVEKPGGEKRIHIGATTQESEYDSFFFPNGGETVTVTVSKIDLVRYMKGAKEEYMKPQQHYRLPILEYYEERYQQTLGIQEDYFQICFEKNIDNKRYYLSRPSGNKLNKNYNYITNICLPLITNFVFIRIENSDGSHSFFLKPEFVTPENKENNQLSLTNEKIPLQQIFYGAPGTGKSHRIKEEEGVKKAEKNNLVFRTTFHPDSDYSTFVGAYKPTIDKRAVRNVAGDIVKNTDKEDVYEECITYSFVPQAFLQAYVAAWNNPEENVYLVIEEINRGNCAQIFGDLFQLLDRDNEGFSEYPIVADNDLKKYLNGKDEEGKDVLTNKDGIKDGKLRLPMNLYIWATMNTSDQSLFPIDSAFKRRWDWVYVPIDTAKETWYIKIEDRYYSWTKFLNKVNDELLTDETAEDKHLGFYFCKATEKKDGTESDPNVITAETFVGKVLFYLWNDVFKVYGIPSSIGSSKDWSYRKFYQTDGKVDMEKVAKLMEQLKIAPEGGNEKQAEEAKDQ